MTPEEYKLKNNSMKKGKKKRPSFQNPLLKPSPNSPQSEETPENGSKNNPKQPFFILKMVIKEKKEEFIKMNIEDLVEGEYKAIEESSAKIQALSRENDEGNDEYKLKLINPSPEKFQNLTTQMKFRLNEGGGECFYKIGVEDNGNPLGITKDMMISSLRNFFSIAP